MRRRRHPHPTLHPYGCHGLPDRSRRALAPLHVLPLRAHDNLCTDATGKNHSVASRPSSSSKTLQSLSAEPWTISVRSGAGNQWLFRPFRLPLYCLLSPVKTAQNIGSAGCRSSESSSAGSARASLTISSVMIDGPPEAMQLTVRVIEIDRERP